MKTAVLVVSALPAILFLLDRILAAARFRLPDVWTRIKAANRPIIEVAVAASAVDLVFWHLYLAIGFKPENGGEVLLHLFCIALIVGCGMELADTTIRLSKERG